jgi:biopolymer transport protein ExbD
MAMNAQRPEGDPNLMVDINTTPLIDVMLVLLIMLIVTIPVQTHAVKLDMPRDTPPLQAVPPVVTLDIDSDGTMLWNDTVLADRKMLEDRLEAAARQEPQPEIHVAPNKLTKYSYVAMVLAEAQRLGIVKIGLAGNEQFMD